MQLKIVSLKGKKFKGENNIICELTGGYGLYNDQLGYVSFIAANERNGVKTPYQNKRKVIQSILDQGGLTSYKNVEWLKTFE